MPDVFTPEVSFGTWAVGMQSTDTAPAYRTVNDGVMILPLWILASGAWNDNGVWSDTATWKDTA